MPVGTCISSLGTCLLSPLLMFKLVCYWVVCAVLCLAAQSCPALETPWTVAGQASLSMSIHQARILEEVAMPSTSRFPWSSNWTRSPALQADSSPAELPGELLSCHSLPMSGYLTTTAYITWNIFLHFVDCLFTSGIVPFDIHKFFILMKSSVPFLFSLMLFCHIYYLLDKSKILCVSILLKIAKVFFLLFFDCLFVCFSTKQHGLFTSSIIHNIFFCIYDSIDILLLEESSYDIEP